MIETTFRTHCGAAAVSPARQRFVAVLGAAIRDLDEAAPTPPADTARPIHSSTLAIAGARR